MPSLTNLTRDPFHTLVSTMYCKNMSKLVITVNGVTMDRNLIVNVYRRPHIKPPYVEMFQVDDQGKIVEVNGKPVTYPVEGDIEIRGTPSHCGCWRGKRIQNWWHKLNEKRPGW